MRCQPLQSLDDNYYQMPTLLHPDWWKQSTSSIAPCQKPRHNRDVHKNLEVWQKPQKHLLHNSCWRVVTRNSIKIFKDRWLPFLIAHLHRPINWDLTISHVSHLLAEDGRSWNQDLVNILFGVTLAEVILQTPFNYFDEEDREKFIWLPSKDGRISSCNYYKFLRSQRPPTITFGSSPSPITMLNRLWKLLTLSRIEHFIWRACLTLFLAMPA